MNAIGHVRAIPYETVIMLLMTVVASNKWAADVASDGAAEHSGTAEHSGRMPWC